MKFFVVIYVMCKQPDGFKMSLTAQRNGKNQVKVVLKSVFIMEKGLGVWSLKINWVIDNPKIPDTTANCQWGGNSLFTNGFILCN